MLVVGRNSYRGFQDYLTPEHTTIKPFPVFYISYFRHLHQHPFNISSTGMLKNVRAALTPWELLFCVLQPTRTRLALPVAHQLPLMFSAPAKSPSHALGHDWKNTVYLDSLTGSEEAYPPTIR